MSKSLGNIVDPFALADKYGAEAVRYYLISDIATGKDADFSEERLIERYNTDLANTLGNLLNRTLTMLHRYRAGRVPTVPDSLKTKDKFSQWSTHTSEPAATTFQKCRDSFESV